MRHSIFNPGKTTTPLTFLCAHAVKVDRSRYEKSAERAESARSHGDAAAAARARACAGGRGGRGAWCGRRAALCRLHNSRKFI